MPCPATDFEFRFSITLLTVVITRIDYDALNKIVSVSLAVGSCQDILFVADRTATTPEVPYALCSMGKFEGAWFNS